MFSMTRLLRLALKVDGAARWQPREALLDLAQDLPAGAAEDGAEAAVEAELGVHVADEVERGEALLAVGQAEAAAELLEEDGGALGGAEEEHGVDLGDVDALVEDVDGEDDVDLAGAQAVEDGGAGVLVGVGGEGGGGDAGVVELRPP